MIRKKASRIFLEVNSACNLKCTHCDIHTFRDPEDALSLDEMESVLQAISTLFPDANLYFSGGEPLLKKPKILQLARQAKSLGIQSHFTTNGTLFREHDYDEFVTSGIRSITVSIDHHIATIHDGMRGVNGTHLRASQSLQKLISAIKRNRARCSLFASVILSSANLAELKQLCDYLMNLGADGIVFQALQPSFGRETALEWRSKDPLWPNDPELISNGLSTLKELKKSGTPILQSQTQLSEIEKYFLNDAQIRAGYCKSMMEHIMIDIRGNVRFCFNQDELGLEVLGNIRKNSLEEIWENSQQVRTAHTQCARHCGIMLCHS